MSDTLPSAEKFRLALHFDEIYRHHVRDIRLVRPAIKSIARLAPNPDFAWINVHDPESGTTYALTNEHIHSTPYSGSAEATTTILPLDLTRLDVGGDPDGVEQSSLDVEMHVRHHPEVIAIHARGDFAHRSTLRRSRNCFPRSGTPSGSNRRSVRSSSARTLQRLYHHEGARPVQVT